MTHSEQINELATALVKAQAAIKGAKKDSENPHFRSKYADLASVWDACREPLTKNGLSIIQSPRFTVSEAGMLVEVETMLLHVTGQWMKDTLAVPVGKPDAQGVGSALTYARRYSLSAFVGVAPEDDDGNAAVATNGHAKAEPVIKPKGFDKWALDIAAAADEGLDKLNEAWKDSKPEMREYTMKHEAEWRQRIRAKAEQADEKRAKVTA